VGNGAGQGGGHRSAAGFGCGSGQGAAGGGTIRSASPAGRKGKAGVACPSLAATQHRALNSRFSTWLDRKYSDALFKSGSFELRTAARERLAKVSGIVLAYPSLHLAVDGHTDSVGDEYNRHLSERRAQAVRDDLVQQGISPDAIAASGFGKTEPLAS